MAAPPSFGNKLKQKPFAILVIFGALVYVGLAFLVFIFQLHSFDPLVILFTALFFISGFLILWGKRWSLGLAAGLSVFFLIPNTLGIGEVLSNPARPDFWLAISVEPLLILVVILAILSLVKWKKGLAQTTYLASPKSSGGLFVLAVIGFIVGGLVVGGFSASTITRILGGGGQAADIRIVPNAPQAAVPFSPATLTVSFGGTVTWFNGDSIIHTVTSDTAGLFDSGPLNPGEYWSHTFTQPGTYTYHCTPHPQMTGAIVVSP